LAAKGVKSGWEAGKWLAQTCMKAVMPALQNQLDYMHTDNLYTFLPAKACPPHP